MRKRKTSTPNFLSPPLAASLLGIYVSGDLGGLTIYTTKHGKKVWYQEAPALKPASAMQQAQRDRFASAQAEWKSLSPSIKADLEALVNKASLCLTGQNLWIRVAIRHEAETLNTLMRQTGINVPQPTPV